MFSKLFKVICLLLPIVSLGAPVDSCQSQADCLAVSFSDCDVVGYRTVCLEWKAGPTCDKAQTVPTDATISHACAGLGGSKDPDNTGSEDWHDNTPRCQSVLGGSVAIFGVKDGKGCSLPGTYLIDGSTEEVACSGPENVCDGNNVKECGWSIDVPSCGLPPDPCLEHDICEVHIPCETPEGCPCDEYKFVGGVGGVCPP